MPIKGRDVIGGDHQFTRNRSRNPDQGRSPELDGARSVWRHEDHVIPETLKAVGQLLAGKRRTTTKRRVNADEQNFHFVSLSYSLIVLCYFIKSRPIRTR